MSDYTEDSIKSLDWRQHIRLRPGMYIGRLGDGSSFDDGIYVMIKEVIDNAVDEFVMGTGKKIDIKTNATSAIIRDYGRGIPFGKLVDCASQINTGAKYDSQTFKKAAGLNGVGIKAVNALSTKFTIQSWRDGESKSATFSTGLKTDESKVFSDNGKNGTMVEFQPDQDIFTQFNFQEEYLENMFWNYVYLNKGLKINWNGKEFYSENGLLDLLKRKVHEEVCYDVIQLTGDDIQVAFTHGNGYGELYYSFANGQHTTQGGTHQTAFREALVKTIREFYKKDFDAKDIRTAIIGAISIRICDPIFESQTKTSLGSDVIEIGGISMKSWINDFIKRELDNHLHRNPSVAEKLQQRIIQSEKERKDLAGIKDLAKDRAKKASLHNRKLRDCKFHFNSKHEKAKNSTIFITEGDSASGSITQARDTDTQAVFSLKGKPLNCFGSTKKMVYENEEFNLLQHALDIEDGLDTLRYNKVVIATDADVDGMHIRLLMMTFFLQFFPDLVKNGHLYILQTPLFRVRRKKDGGGTFYCYSDAERISAISKTKDPEITRFKGLGEISPDEFEKFIDKSIRLLPVIVGEDSIEETLAYYMGDNTQERQDFIVGNLRQEEA